MVLCNLCLVRAFIRVLVLIATCAALLPACSLPFSTLVLTPAGSPNPPWPQQCPLRIALVVDLSDSMEPHLDAVEQSVGELVEALGAEALDGVPNEVAVVIFGSGADVAVPMTDVSDDDIRGQVSDLGTTRGSTNWEAALTAARGLQPDVVVLLSDGEPDSLGPAVDAANALKSDGTRVVGLGIGLHSSSVGNLVAVTGPAAGDDFYQTSSSGLLDNLFEVASKACGMQVGPVPPPPVPQPASPAPPAPGSFPLIPVIIAGVAAVLAAVVGGILLSRRRSDLAVVSTPAPPPPGSTISPEPLASSVVAEDDDPAAERTVTPAPDAERKQREPRRISLTRIQNAEPSHRPDEGSAGTGDGAGKDVLGT